MNSMDDYITKTARCVFELQKEIGLYFLEARVLMTRYTGGLMSLTKEYDMTPQDMDEVSEQAYAKLEASGKTIEEICGNHLPHIMMAD